MSASTNAARFVLQRPAGQVRQLDRIRLARDQRSEDRPAADPKDVAHEPGNFQVGDIERFLNALRVLCDFSDQLFARAREIP